MGFFVYRKYYFPQARTYWQALDLLREAEEKGIEKDFFMSQWAKVEKTGWLDGFLKQLGRK